MKFSLGQVVGAAITSFEKHWRRLILATVLWGVVVFGLLLAIALPFAVLPLMVLKKVSSGLILASLITMGLVLFSGLLLGYSSFVLSIAREEQPSYDDLFKYIFTWRSVQALGMYFLGVSAILLGFLCLIVPGVIILARFFPSTYVLIDQSHGVLDTLNESNRLVKGATIRTLVLILFSHALRWLPMIGSLIAAHLYLELLDREQEPVEDQK